MNIKNILFFCIFSTQSWLTISASNENHHHFFQDISTAFIVQRVLYVAADLAIADILADSPCTIHELAIKTQTNEDALSRLMHLLQLYNIFYCDDNNQYHNSERSAYMRSDHPETVQPLLLHEDETRWNALGNLKLSITTGKPAFDEIYDMSYFSYTALHPVLNERFNNAMKVISDFEEKDIVSKYTFGNFPIIADLGGGSGGMLNKILKEHNTAQVILADLPEVIEKHCLSDSFSDRFSLHALDLFKPISINADLFILKRILHDWDDEKALGILRNIAATMSSSNKLLIIEALITNEVSDKSKLLAQVDLLLLAIFGGGERTYEAYKNIIHKAGLTITNVYKTESLVSIIECELKQ